MANILKVSIQETIRSLAARGWTHRWIARALGLNRRTVARYAVPAGSVPKSPPGSEGGGGSKCTISPPGLVKDPKGAERPRVGRPSE